MEYGVYYESSIVDLKPKVLDFLAKLVEKAKEVKDSAIAFKKQDLADMAGVDIRTTYRYLGELEEKKVLQAKGRRGRAGGTVILFNTELIRFDTSEKALVNSDEPISIDDIVEQKLPKKPKKPRDSKRNRRTKQEMLEAEILNNQNQSELNKLNNQLEQLGGTPDWSWFKGTEDPIGNYRTYLITRLYNRYAVLFTDRHNVEVEVYHEGNKVPFVSNDYDVLPADFFGSPRWNQFEKLRLFCEENSIDPTVYLSAQFNRSIFNSSAKNNKKMLPYVNSLIGDTAYDVFKQYCNYQKQVSWTYASYQMIPAKFGDDFVVRALIEAYTTADKGTGLLQYRYAIEDFITGFGGSDKEDALMDFYRMTEENLRNQKVSYKTRDTIKKYIMLQSMILTGGAASLPSYLILGSEMTQIILASISSSVIDTEQAREMKSRALGALTYPTLDADGQKEKGAEFLYQTNVLYETPKVLKLIMQRKGLYLSLADLNQAFKEYGSDKIPVDDYSVLDADQIIKFMQNEVDYIEQPEVNLEDATITREWELTGNIQDEDTLESSLSEFLNSVEI